MNIIINSLAKASDALEGYALAGARKVLGDDHFDMINVLSASYERGRMPTVSPSSSFTSGRAGYDETIPEDVGSLRSVGRAMLGDALNLGGRGMESGLSRVDNMTRSLLRMNDGADYMGGVGRSLTEGDDAILKGVDADSAAAFFRGESDIIAGVGDDVVGNLRSVRTNMQEQLQEGGTEFTNEAVRAMYRNVSEGGNVNAGLSAAGMTRSNIPGFQAMGDPSNLLGSMAMGGLVGAGAANIVGGDPMEGATLGAMAGAAGSIGAKVFRESIGDIETSVMKKVLKGDFADKAGPGNIGTYKGRRVERRGDEFVLERKKGGENIYKETDAMGRVINRRAKFQEVSARSQNLNALAGGGGDSSGLGRVDKFIYDRMTDPNKTSLGMQSRMATASGAMLAGAMFSSARTKDKRRGFNRNRGNRF